MLSLCNILPASCCSSSSFGSSLVFNILQLVKELLLLEPGTKSKLDSSLAAFGRGFPLFYTIIFPFFCSSISIIWLVIQTSSFWFIALGGRLRITRSQQPVGVIAIEGINKSIVFASQRARLATGIDSSLIKTSWDLKCNRCQTMQFAIQWTLIGVTRKPTKRRSLRWLWVMNWQVVCKKCF